LKSFIPKTKVELKKEINFWNENKNEILKDIINKKIGEEKQRLHNEQNIKDSIQGLQGEDQMKPIIEKCFNDILIKTKYIYNKVDFIGNSGFLYEVKTFKGNYNEEYRNVLLGTNKLICENLIFLFLFGNNDIYFIQASFKVFEDFEITKIKNKNRLIKNEVYLIPNHYLEKLDINKTYKFDLLINDFERDIRKKIIDLDKKTV
jgi:hypothetical protein